MIHTWGGGVGRGGFRTCFGAPGFGGQRLPFMVDLSAVLVLRRRSGVGSVPVIRIASKVDWSG